MRKTDDQIVYVFCEEENFYKLHKFLLHQSYTILSLMLCFQIFSVKTSISLTYRLFQEDFEVHIPFNCFYLKKKLAKFINFQPI